MDDELRERIFRMDERTQNMDKKMDERHQVTEKRLDAHAHKIRALEEWCYWIGGIGAAAIGWLKFGNGK